MNMYYSWFSLVKLPLLTVNAKDKLCAGCRKDQVLGIKLLIFSVSLRDRKGFSSLHTNLLQWELDLIHGKNW